jgi:tetratricopeptide (TPR) repeat protein
MTEPDSTHDDEPDRTDIADGPEAVSEVHNTVSVGTVTGVVIQAGTIDAIHQHLPPRQVPIPRQLPPAPPHFIGRTSELTQLTDALDTAVETGTTVMISALAGAGGVGKTALALHWANSNLHRFPDGQLFVDLQGFSPAGSPVKPAEAVRGFLAAFGIELDRMSADLHAQTGLYRSLVASKRILIVLDNAASIEQVEPLLPGSPACTVLVTSRRRIAGLATSYDARLLDLDVMAESDARALLVGRLGLEQVAAEPAAVADLLAICAGLPLALQIVASRANHHPDFPLANLAEELHDTVARLDGLDAGDVHTNLRVVLSWSAQHLGAQEAEVFGLLGIAPGIDISLHAAASLASLPTAQVRAALRELENASLIQQHVPGRYRMHDLIRLYAADTAHRNHAGRDEALRRLVDFYTRTALVGDERLAPFRDRRGISIPLDPPTPWDSSAPILDEATAMAWFDSEHMCLLAAQQAAITRSWHQAIWNLAWVLDAFHRRRGHLHDQLVVWLAGLTAAHQLSTAQQPHDHTALTIAHQSLGYAYARLGHHDEALRHLGNALAQAGHDDPASAAHTHRAFAWALGRQGELRLALEHARRARGLYQQLGQREWEAQALNDMGWLFARIGDHDQTRTHCQLALDLCLDDVGYVYATVWESMGHLDRLNGRHQQALAHYQQAVTALDMLGDTYDVADVLDGMSHAYAALGEHDHARTVWREASQLYRQQGRVTDAERVQQQLNDLDRSECVPDFEVETEQGVQLIKSLVSDPATNTSIRRWATEALEKVDGYQDYGQFEALAMDPGLTIPERLKAARRLTETSAERGARLYETLASDVTLATAGRLQAASALAQIDGYRDRGARLLEALAVDPGLDATDRIWAAGNLARGKGHVRDHGMRLLETLATDPALSAYSRAWASRRLAELSRRL